MKRKLLIVLLAAGTIFGFGSAFARHRMHGEQGWCWNHEEREARFHDRVAEVCAAAALRVTNGSVSNAPGVTPPSP